MASQQKHERRFEDIAVAPDGKGVWTTDAYQNLYFWPLDGGKLGAGEKVGGELGQVVHLGLSPNGRLLATSSFGKLLSLWDAAARKQLALVSADIPLRDCVFSPDGKRLVVASNTNFLLEYDLMKNEARKLPMNFTKPDVEAMSLTFSPDGKYFSTGHTQPYATVWDAPNMTFRHYLNTDMAAIPEVAYTQDSTLLAFVFGGGEVHLWKPETDKVTGRVAVLKADPEGKLPKDKPYYLRALAFSPDGTVLAATGEQGEIILWTQGG